MTDKTKNLYETLGVSVKASKTELRKAYRGKAKAAHPDTGGSPAQFQQLQLAHDILTDDDRRAKYDATGDTEEKKVDNATADAVQILVTLLDMVLGQIDNKGHDPTEYDIIGDMKIALANQLGKFDTEKSRLAKQEKKLERLLGKFKIKKGENFLENAIRQKIMSCQASGRALEQQIIPGKMAHDMLKEYSYEFTRQSQGANMYGLSPSMGNLMEQVFRGGF